VPEVLLVGQAAGIVVPVEGGIGELAADVVLAFTQVVGRIFLSNQRELDAAC